MNGPFLGDLNYWPPLTTEDWEIEWTPQLVVRTINAITALLTLFGEITCRYFTKMHKVTGVDSGRIRFLIAAGHGTGSKTNAMKFIIVWSLTALFAILITFYQLT